MTTTLINNKSKQQQLFYLGLFEQDETNATQQFNKEQKNPQILKEQYDKDINEVGFETETRERRER